MSKLRFVSSIDSFVLDSVTYLYTVIPLFMLLYLDFYLEFDDDDDGFQDWIRYTLWYVLFSISISVTYIEGILNIIRLRARCALCALQGYLQIFPQMILIIIMYGADEEAINGEIDNLLNWSCISTTVALAIICLVPASSQKDTHLFTINLVWF